MKIFFTAIWLLISFNLLASSYSEYDQYLSQRWPIIDQTECSEIRPEKWQGLAEEMISLQSFDQLDLNSDEKMILRNLLISAAYNRLFTYSLRRQQVSTPNMAFIWIAAGSQASVTVGHALQNGLTRRYLPGSRQYNVFQKLEALHYRLPRIPSLFLNYIPAVKRKTAENNWRVYSDIYWQHLAYMNCGLDYIKALNLEMVNRHLSKGEVNEIGHYQEFISVWEDVDSGLYMQANMKLIKIEQYNILQRYMYNDLSAKMANLMLIFNGLAAADLSGPDGRRIKNFSEYSLEHHRYPNLSHYPTRFAWMKYVVSEQGTFIGQLETADRVEEVFEKSLFETYQTIKDYDN
ncbi:MAG: hypothetical protein AB7I27_02250 [Bacteriovoracaceae bacterium]